MSWHRFAFVLLLAVALVAPAIAQDEPAEPPSERAGEEEAVPEPTAAPAPSPTAPAPSATPTPGPGAILLSDNFDDPAAGVLPRTSADPDRYTRGYTDGEYRLHSQSDGVPFAAVPGSYENASLAVDARIVGDTDRRFIALYCRVQPGPGFSGYRLFVAPSDGSLRLQRIDGGTSVPLMDWQSRAPIARGSARNRIELSCAGSVITIMINGTPMGFAFDGTYRGGGMQIAAISVIGTPTIDVRLDNLVVTQRAEETPPPPGPYEGSWSGSTAGGRDNSFTVSHNSVISLRVNFEIVSSGLNPCVTTGSSTLSPERPAPIVNDSFSVTVSVPGRSTYTVRGEREASAFEQMETYVVSGRFTSPATASGEIEIAISGPPDCAGRVASPWTARKG